MGVTVDKSILMDYFDSCRLVEETEKDISKLMGKRSAAQDVVSGSNPEFPYEARHFRIQGIPQEEDRLFQDRMAVLAERKMAAEKKKVAVERWMLTLSSRMQRIIRYHVIDGLSWEETATMIGRDATGESIRTEWRRFLGKK